MKHSNVIDGPPISPDVDAHPERWSVWCRYHGAVAASVQEQALRELDTAAGFVETDSLDEQLLILREWGYLDEAIQGAIISLRGIHGVVTNRLSRVEVTSLRDAERNGELGGQPVYDVTQTVLNALTS